MFPNLNMLGINEKLRDDWRKLTQAEKAAYKPAPTSALPVASVSTSTTSITEVEASGNVLSTSVATAAASTISARATETVLRGQTIIHKCGVCGRMFLDEGALDDHKKAEHDLRPEDVLDLVGEVTETAENDDPEVEIAEFVASPCPGGTQ